MTGIALWSLAMVWCGAATSYRMLFAARLALGVAIGFLVSGNIAALSWRAPFVVLAVLGVVLAYFIVCKFPEPRRGGRGIPRG